MAYCYASLARDIDIVTVRSHSFVLKIGQPVGQNGQPGGHPFRRMHRSRSGQCV